MKRRKKEKVYYIKTPAIATTTRNAYHLWYAKTHRELCQQTDRQKAEIE